MVYRINHFGGEIQSILAIDNKTHPDIVSMQYDSNVEHLSYENIAPAEQNREHNAILSSLRYLTMLQIKSTKVKYHDYLCLVPHQVLKGRTEFYEYDDFCLHVIGHHGNPDSIYITPIIKPHHGTTVNVKTRTYHAQSKLL